MSFKKYAYNSDKEDNKKEDVVDEIEEVAEKEVEEEVKAPEVTPAPAPVPEAPKKKIPQIARINIELCNIRKTPDMNGEIVKVVTKNAEFKVRGDEENGFVPITIQGDDAFVKADCVVVFDNPAFVANEEAMKIGR